MIARDLARQWSIDATFDNAGTEPDEDVSPHATAAIMRLGLTYSGRPRGVAADDIETADVVVSMGCAAGDLPATPNDLVEWSGLPDASSDVESLVEDLTARVGELLATRP